MSRESSSCLTAFRIFEIFCNRQEAIVKREIRRNEVELNKLSGVVVNIDVEATRRFRMRVWLAARIFVVGAYVLGGTPRIRYV
jgi:hypothetical protein